MKEGGKTKKATTQKFIEITDISDDIVIQPHGNACLIIEVTAVNFALLSQEEQDSRIFAYAALLNSLSFPMQVLIVSKKLDISSYLSLLDYQAQNSASELLRDQIRLYRDFVAELVKVNTVLDKKFYIVLHYNSLEKGVGGVSAGVKKGNQAQADVFERDAKASLHSKADSLHSQLARLNLRSKTLGKEELVKLFYELYNGTGIEVNQVEENIKTAIITSGGAAK